MSTISVMSALAGALKDVYGKVSVQPGALILPASSGDDCCELFVWLRIIRRLKMSGLDAPAIAHCPTVSVLDIEVGVVRCIDLGDDAEPDVEEDSVQVWTDAENLDLIVQTAMRGSKHWRMGEGRPFGPSGFLIGWTQEVRVVS